MSDILVKNEELVKDDAFGVLDAFRLPTRDWNLIIDTYNKDRKRKFPFTALQCKTLVEYVKKGIPVKYMFKTLGLSGTKQSTLLTKFSEMEEKLEALSSKDALTDAELAQYKDLINHPTRILMSDLERAEGVSSLEDFERFNNYANVSNDTHLAKMKVKYKDLFSEKQETGSVNVQINVGGDWAADL